MVDKITVLQLLQMGCKIEFPSGFYLSGDVENRYIDVGTQFGHEGCWNLSENGLVEAIADLEKMAAENGAALGNV